MIFIQSLETALELLKLTMHVSTFRKHKRVTHKSNGLMEASVREADMVAGFVRKIHWR